MSIKASFFVLSLIVASFGDKLELTQNPSSLNTPRASFGCVVLNGTTVAFGGQITVDQLTDTVEYTLSNGTFVYGANLSNAQMNPSYTTFGDRYLFVTGLGSQVYDLHTHTWENLNANQRSRPNAVAFFKLENVTTVYNDTNVTSASNVLYEFGLDTTGSYSFEWTIVVFDSNGTIYEVGNWTVVDLPVSDQYKSLPSTQLTVANNKIYWVGGLRVDMTNYTSVVDVWSLDLSQFVFNSSNSNFTLQAETSLPTSLYGAAATSFNNQLYVFGGAAVSPVWHTFNTTGNITTNNTNNWVFQNQVYSYDGKTWTTTDVTLVHNAGGSCAVLNSAAGQVYVLGGGVTSYAEYQLVPFNSTVYATVQTLAWVSDGGSSHGLGAGAIAGIVIGVLVGVAILIGVVVFISKRGKRSQYREV